MANARVALRIRQLVEATCDMGDVGKLFRLADANGDGDLVREEFGAFIASLVKVYPGSSPPYFEEKDIDEAFAAMLDMGRGEFAALPKWKRDAKKKNRSLDRILVEEGYVAKDQWIRAVKDKAVSGLFSIFGWSEAHVEVQGGRGAEF